MKLVLLSFLVLAATSATAQVDLSRDPGKPLVAPKKSNAQLLKESQQPVQTQSDSINNASLKANGIVTNPTGAQYGEGGKLNQQSQQYNLGGGTKATNTINYDNSGKIQGSSTTIDFGKKKK
jgi:hypothetical protein